MVTIPLLAQDEMNDYLKGRIDGENQAKGEEIWFLSGCLLGLVGVLIPLVYEPTVPSAQLMGKSSAYVRGFSEGYKEKAKKENAKYAAYGCITSGVVTGCLYAIMIIAVATSVEEEDDYYY